MAAIQFIIIFLSIAVHVLHTTWNLVILRCFAEEHKKVNQDWTLSEMQLPFSILSFEITIMDILEGKYILICCPEILIIAIWNNRIQNDPISPEKFLVKQKHNHWPRNLLFTNIPLPLPLWVTWTTFFRRMWVTAYLLFSLNLVQRVGFLVERVVW